MPTTQITNPANAFGYSDPTDNLDRDMTPMVNGSSFTMLKGSVVKHSTKVSLATAGQVPTFDNVGTLADVDCLGILQADTASGAIGQVVRGGISLVQVSSSAIPALGDQLTPSTVAAASTAASTNTFGLVKTTTGAVPGSIIGTARSTVLDASSSSSVGSYVYAAVRKV